MKTVVVLAASGAAVGGLYLGGAFQGGEVYPLPIGEARARLERVALPQSVTGTAAGSRAELSVNPSSDTYSWKVTAGTQTMAVFSAHLTAEGPTRTRVLLGYANGKTQSPWADRIMSTSFMRSYAESSFHEQVDAVLEGRRAEQGQAMQDFAAHAAAHPEEMREVGLATQGIFKEVANQIEAERTLGANYQQTTARERMAAATRPTSDATRPTTDLTRD